MVIIRKKDQEWLIEWTKRFYNPRICSLRRKDRTKEPTPSSELFFLPFANPPLFLSLLEVSPSTYWLLDFLGDTSEKRKEVKRRIRMVELQYNRTVNFVAGAAFKSTAGTACLSSSHHFFLVCHLTTAFSCYRFPLSSLLRPLMQFLLLYLTWP